MEKISRRKFVVRSMEAAAFAGACVCGLSGCATFTKIGDTPPLPAKVYSGEGIAQLLFLESDEACETSYADRKGTYQAQVGIVPPRVHSNLG